MLFRLGRDLFENEIGERLSASGVVGSLGMCGVKSAWVSSSRERREFFDEEDCVTITYTDTIEIVKDLWGSDDFRRIQGVFDGANIRSWWVEADGDMEGVRVGLEVVFVFSSPLEFKQVRHFPL